MFNSVRLLARQAHAARAFAACALTVCLPVAAAAQPAASKRPMTFEDLQAIHRIADPQVSASGKWVMFSVTDVDLPANRKTTHLWVVGIDGRQPEHVALAAADANKAGESGGRFSPDGKQVLFTSARSGSQQVWLAPWNEADGTVGKPRQLTSLSTEADGAIWSPDSKSIAFTSDVYPECSADGIFDAKAEACKKQKDDAAASSPVKAMIFDRLLYRHWDHYQGTKRSHILLVDATDGAKLRDLTPQSQIGDAIAPTFSLGGPTGYAFAPDSKEFAYVVNLDPQPAASTNNDIYTLDLTQPGAKPVKISTSPGSDDAPAYSPDGKYLAFRSQARAGYESDRFRLMVYDRKSKTIREVPKNFDGWVDEFTWRGSQHIVFATAEQGEENLLSASVSSGQGDLSSVARGAEYGSLAAAGSTTAVTGMRVDAPAEVFRVSDDREAPRQLTHLNEALLSKLNLAKMESFNFPGAGGTTVQGFLIRPPDFDPAKKYPLKFLIHGGPQGAWGDAWSYRWNPELFAANGYVVVMINPRGSTGYGQAFVDGVNGDWGGKPYQDLMLGLDYAEKKYPFIDKSRECALGASYGGFMANWILTHTDRFACIVSHDGMYNPVSAYGSTEEIWFNEWEFRRQGIGPNGGPDPEPAQPWRYEKLPADQDPFRRWSPARFIDRAKTPTLVIHGQKDYRLDVSEGFQLFTALQRRGVPSKMLYFPDEGHWVLKPQNSKLWYETVNDWCDRWTHTNRYARQ